MGIRSRYNTLKERLSYAFGTPDCRECGEDLFRERTTVKPLAEELGGRIWLGAATSMSILLIGIAGLIGSIAYALSFGESAAKPLLHISFGMMITGTAGVFSVLPIAEYYGGKIAREKLEEHPLCYECLRDENRELWTQEGSAIHADYLK